MSELLRLTTHLPEQAFAPGEAVVVEGPSTGALWVLVSGELEVSRGDVVVNTITQPGALVGEVSVLLGAPFGATVRAVAPSVLRHAADGRALLALHPDITRWVAVGLAERLNVVTSYLVDLKQQYADAPGLDMVSDVLRQLSQRPAVPARPGSAREPDPDY